MRKTLYSAAGILILTFGISYFTWCWGMWESENPFMKSVFQCACPRVSEQTRYKPFKVIASACSNPHLLDDSPNGKFVLLAVETDKPAIARLNLENGEIRTIHFGKALANFLTDDLLLVGSIEEGRYFLLDQSDGTSIEMYLEPHLEKAFLTAHDMEKVWWQSGLTIGINSDFKSNPESRILFMTVGSTAMEQRQSLTVHGIDLEEDSFSYRPENGLYADLDGIHLGDKLIVETGQSLDESPEMFGPTKWVLGGDAVIYESLNHSLTLFGEITPSPQPVLLLEVPIEYRSTNSTTP
jgi:hypothetical protein